MARDTGDNALFDDSLNPSFGLDPAYGVRSVSLIPKEVFPEPSSAILTSTSATYAPPGSTVRSFAPEPGQPVNLIQDGADLRPQQVVQAQQVAPPLRQPSPTPGADVPPTGLTSMVPAPKLDPNAALQNERDALVKQRD